MRQVHIDKIGRMVSEIVLDTPESAARNSKAATIQSFVKTASPNLATTRNALKSFLELNGWGSS